MNYVVIMNIEGNRCYLPMASNKEEAIKAAEEVFKAAYPTKDYKDVSEEVILCHPAEEDDNNLVWEVYTKVKGSCEISVEAESEEDAKDIAKDLAFSSCDFGDLLDVEAEVKDVIAAEYEPEFC